MNRMDSLKNRIQTRSLGHEHSVYLYRDGRQRGLWHEIHFLRLVEIQILSRITDHICVPCFQKSILACVVNQPL